MVEEEQEKGAEEGKKEVRVGVTTPEGVAGVEAEGEGKDSEGEGKGSEGEERELEGQGMAGVAGGAGEEGGIGGREEGTMGTDDDGSQLTLPFVLVRRLFCLHRMFVLVEIRFDFVPPKNVALVRRFLLHGIIYNLVCGVFFPGHKRQEGEGFVTFPYSSS